MNQILLPQSPAECPATTPIIASWQRSADCGVNPDAREAPVVIVGIGFEDLRWRHRELRNAATPIFLATQDLLTDSRSMMVLTSAEGIVLDVAGNTQTLDAGERIHLLPGGDWREAAIGTNGIGMALSTRAPAHVHADEHFCAVVKYWTCAAAPVREPGTGAILGVLDISGPPETYHRNNLALAVAAARQIETVLAGRRTRERAQLLEACLTQLSLADAAGLVAIDRRGCLVHVTGSVPLSIGVGERVPGLEAGAPMEVWASRLPNGFRPEWFHPVVVDGAQIGAMLVIPAIERAHQLLADPRQASSGATEPLFQGTASLDEVEHSAIKQALAASRGNLTRAARALGISRSTLYRKVQRHGL